MDIWGVGVFCIMYCIVVGCNKYKEWFKLEGNVGVEDRFVVVNIIIIKVSSMC